jgi:hypothetical protein
MIFCLAFGIFFSLTFSLLAQFSLSHDCLTTYFYFSSKFIVLILALEVFYYIYTIFPLTDAYTHELSFCRARTCASFSQTIAYIRSLGLMAKFGVLWVILVGS